MKKLIKLLPIVLAMLMLFSFGAFAEETGEIPDGEQDVTEVTLPEAPTNLSNEPFYISEGGYVELRWDTVPNADGYNLYMKEKGAWVLKQTIDYGDTDLELLYGLLYNSKYEIGIKSYITVDGVNYESEEMCTDVIVTSTTLPRVSFHHGTYLVKDGIKVSWEKYDGISGYRLYVRKDGKWVKVKDIYGKDNNEYIYTDVVDGNNYYFAVKSFVKGTEGLKFSSLSSSYKVCYEDVTRVKGFSSTVTASSVTLNWGKVEGNVGYRIFLYQSGKWKALKTTTARSYTVTGLEASKKYIFRVRAYTRVNGEVVWYPVSENYSVITGEDFTRVKGFSSTVTDSSVTLKWGKVEGNVGYRIFVYQSGKWKALKTTTARSYTVTGLEASKKYIFRVRAYTRVDGEVVWYPYSKNYSVITGSKAVDAYRVKNLQKDFNDGSWYVKVKDMDDGYGGKVTMTLAGKGKDLFLRYDYGDGLVIKYFYQSSKSRLYVISDADKEYIIVPKDEAEDFIELMQAMAEVFKPTNLNKVSAYTTVYNDKTAVKEYYNDSVYGIIRCYFFVNDKLVGMSVKYKNGTYEKFSSISFTDTPSSSLFKVPSGYKKVSWN